MSLIPAGTTIIQAVAAQLLPLIYIRPRMIGGIIANVTIQELANDEVVLTEHPVEQGAAITDHAFKKPSRVRITAGWSNSSLPSLGLPTYCQQIYDALLTLQRSRVPFDVITGKRFYQNMLMPRLEQVTDERTENALMVVCECQEILIVSTQTVTVPPAQNMQMPQINSATENRGQVTVRPTAKFNAAAAPWAGL